jgi:hypothetical protein
MTYEYQRSDRDKYIKLDCMMINGYLDALDRARKTIPMFRESELCENPNTADRFSFPAADYSKLVEYTTGSRSTPRVTSIPSLTTLATRIVTPKALQGAMQTTVQLGN